MAIPRHAGRHRHEGLLYRKSASDNQTLLPRPTHPPDDAAVDLDSLAIMGTLLAELPLPPGLGLAGVPSNCSLACGAVSHSTALRQHLCDHCAGPMALYHHMALPYEFDVHDGQTLSCQLHRCAASRRHTLWRASQEEYRAVHDSLTPASALGICATVTNNVQHRTNTHEGVLTAASRACQKGRQLRSVRDKAGQPKLQAST